ncbi:histidine kinase [Pontimonas sp.]|uniref:sensor histidine kinase n=1 Tax=Pontimonas sp. TaxID=2304492 RepID=UPI002870AD57|nr:histidine kinase [Pontimonas sp.]MDR9434128.1 histidine kinase [Pontimonas sp.]
MAGASVVVPLWLVWTLSGVLVLVAVFGLGMWFLWWRQKQRVDTRAGSRVEAENQRIDAELRVAELADRIQLMTEIHDQAAATITSVISQAEGARMVAQADPEVANRVASAIADQSRSALTDLRRVANVGRQGNDHAGLAPTIGSIEELFQGMDDSGLIVKFEESGKAFDVSASAEIAIYRIVQEALNNSRQHGGPGVTVKVSMTWSSNGLQLRIDDDGIRVKNTQRQQWGDGAGYSIADDQRALVEMLDGRGMKDMKSRTEAFGGVFSAHRVPGVGFSLSAAFPTLRFHNAVSSIPGGPSSSAYSASSGVGDDSER